MFYLFMRSRKAPVVLPFVQHVALKLSLSINCLIDKDTSINNEKMSFCKSVFSIEKSSATGTIAIGWKLEA